MSAQLNAPSGSSVTVSQRRRLMILGAISMGSGLSYHLLTPPPIDNRQRPSRLDLEQVVPKVIGDWRVVDQTVQAVNPETQALLDRIYSQVLGRTYVNKQGQAVMLSISYGADQRGSMEAHKPEVCYPAQGFTVTQNSPDQLETKFGNIKVQRLNTHLGTRQEPLTYWFTVGHDTVSSRIQKRVAELKMIVTGEIPDGLLFRVSSIDPDPKHAWAVQDGFVRTLLDDISSEARKRLAGV